MILFCLKLRPFGRGQPWIAYVSVQIPQSRPIETDNNYGIPVTTVPGCMRRARPSTSSTVISSKEPPKSDIYRRTTEILKIEVSNNFKIEIDMRKVWFSLFSDEFYEYFDRRHRRGVPCLCFERSIVDHCIISDLTEKGLYRARYLKLYYI